MYLMHGLAIREAGEQCMIVTSRSILAEAPIAESTEPVSC